MHQTDWFNRRAVVVTVGCPIARASKRCAERFRKTFMGSLPYTVQAMERALLLDTDRVRFDASAVYELSPGKSTAEAVRHGIALSQAGSVSMAQAKLNLSDGQLVFCGGGGETLHKLLDEAGTLVPDLVFDGLELMASSVDL